MPRFLQAALALLAALASGPAGAQQGASAVTVGAITVERPWTRATPGGATVAGGYMRIVNRGPQGDRLVGGSLAAAGRFEVHEMSDQGGVMRMRALERGLEIPPGGAVELRPGGYHAMFLDLSRGLKSGEAVKGTLVFEKAGTVEVTYPVSPIGAASAPAAPVGHHH